MKSSILCAIFALLFTVSLAPPLYSQGQVYLEEEGMLMEVDRKTGDLMLTFEDEEITDRGYEYTVKVRINEKAYAQIFDAVFDGSKFVKMTEEEMAIKFTPFLNRMTPAMTAAEKICERTKCGEVTLRPIFGKSKTPWIITRNSLKPGQRSDRGLTVRVFFENLPPAKKAAEPIRKVVA